MAFFFAARLARIQVIGDSAKRQERPATTNEASIPTAGDYHYSIVW
jgi:hypothetical protein